MKYTGVQLVRMVIRDLIADYRSCADVNYKCRLASDIRVLFANRHRIKLDRYGWPITVSMLQ